MLNSQTHSFKYAWTDRVVVWPKFVPSVYFTHCTLFEMIGSICTVDKCYAVLMMQDYGSVLNKAHHWVLLQMYCVYKLLSCREPVINIVFLCIKAGLI